MSRTKIGGLIAVALLAGASLWPAAIANAGGGCHGPQTQGSGDTVTMAQACFGPSVLEVEPGTRVTFINEDPITHNVSAMAWGSPGDLGKGDSFTTTFDEEGTFPYACTYHYGMTGAIVVGDGSGPGTAKRLDTTPVALEQSDAPSVAQQSQAMGWAVAGIAGVIVGAVAARLIRRRREEV